MTERFQNWVTVSRIRFINVVQIVHKIFKYIIFGKRKVRGTKKNVSISKIYVEDIEKSFRIEIKYLTFLSRESFQEKKRDLAMKNCWKRKWQNGSIRIAASWTADTRRTLTREIGGMRIGWCINSGGSLLAFPPSRSFSRSMFRPILELMNSRHASNNLADVAGIESRSRRYD